MPFGPPTNRRTQPEPKSDKPEQEVWTKVPDKPYFWVNQKGQWRYAPPYSPWGR